MILSLILLIPGCTFTDVTGKIFEDLTGKASSSTASVSVTINAGSPVIFIDSPLNQTYGIRRIGLNFSIQNNNYFNAWYNLNGKNSNVTVTANTTIDGIYGDNTLTFYANDSLGQLNSSNVNFFITQRYAFNYSNFNGSTSNFTNFSFFESELSNHNNITLEILNRGKIVLGQNCNLSFDGDFDSWVNISHNYISLNSSNLSNLNISATLTLTNLSFTTPRILRDGVLCPSRICTEVSYSGGTYVFSVTGFSAYSSEETPTGGQQEGSPGSTGGGGGGASGIVIQKNVPVGDVEISEKIITVQLPQGGTRNHLLTLRNTYQKKVEVTIDLRNLEEFLPGNAQEKVVIELDPGQEQSLNLAVQAPIETMPEIYMKNVKVSFEGQTKTIPVVVEVESLEPLLDVLSTIEKDVVAAGDDFTFQVTITEITEGKALDINITYELRDLNGTTFVKSEEQRNLDKQLTYLTSLRTPENLNAGQYLLYVRVTHNDIVASTSHLISIVKEQKRAPEANKQAVLIMVVIIIIVIAQTIIVYYFIKKKQKRKARPKKKRIKEERKEEPEEQAPKESN